MENSLFQFLFEEEPEVVEPRPLTVSELNEGIKAAVETTFANVWVEGEIVNFRPAASGHWYFSLNDDSSQIGVNCWKSTAARIRFTPENGMNVRIKGRLTFWEQRGDLKLQVDSMQPAGEGALAIAFEQIRKRLEKEGLFEPALKRELPRFPRRVGIVTSRTGAAFADIVHVLSRRAASVDIVLFPASVQGDVAPQSIIAAIAQANRLHLDPKALRGIDVLIVGRGGGSADDLWAFNDEDLARAIRASSIPIISAVGHEIDTTIADLIADLRAATPSAAAEIVAQDEGELNGALAKSAITLHAYLSRQIRLLDNSMCEFERRLHTGHAALFQKAESQLVSMDGRLSIGLLERHRERCESAVSALSKRQSLAIAQTVERRMLKLENTMGRLDALSPLRVLTRGYSITQKADGAIVSRREDVAKGESLSIRLADGKIEATVTSAK